MNKEEFQELFNAYFGEVRKHILYRSGDEEVATDIAQDAFLKIWEKQTAIDRTKVKGLLLKIATDLYVSQYRRTQLSYNFFKTYRPHHETESPEDQLHFQELQAAYDNALQTMPEKQRTVFLMNRIDEMKYREIAEQLNVSVKAIEKRMSQALEHLKTHLKDKITGIILLLLGYCPGQAKNKKLG